MIRFFRILGFAEGLSFLVLLGIAMPMKYMMGEPLAVKYVGWAHGMLFMAYVGLAFGVYDRLNWSVKTLFGAFIAAVFPFGTWVFDRRVFSK